MRGRLWAVGTGPLSLSRSERAAFKCLTLRATSTGRCPLPLVTDRAPLHRLAIRMTISTFGFELDASWRARLPSLSATQRDSGDTLARSSTSSGERL